MLKSTSNGNGNLIMYVQSESSMQIIEVIHKKKHVNGAIILQCTTTPIPMYIQEVNYM